MSLPECFVAGFHDESEVRKMLYSRLGRTSLQVSKLGFGGGSFSGFYDEFEDEEGKAALVEALKKGVNLVDTAPYYGQGRSETLIGKALKGVPREAYLLSTKVGRYTKDWDTMFDYSAERISTSLDQSLGLLGTDHVDILVIHDIEFADIRRVVEETLPQARRLVEAGKARYIAVSGYPLAPLKEAVKLCPYIDLVLSYSRNTLLDNSLLENLPFFKEKGVGVIDAAPTALGLLTNGGGQSWHPANEAIKQLCKEAAAYCQERGVELGRLAVQHALETGAAACLLVGNNTRSLVNSNIGLVVDGLTSRESEILAYLKEKYFTGKVNLHWEGVELAQYKLHLTKKQLH